MSKNEKISNIANNAHNFKSLWNMQRVPNVFEQDPDIPVDPQ